MSSDDGPDLSRFFDRPVLRTPFSALLRPDGSAYNTSQVDRSQAVSVIKAIVAQRYFIKDVRNDEHGVYITVMVDMTENDRMFEEARLVLKRHNMYPRLVDMNGSYVLAIYPMPKRKRSNYTLNLVMFAATLFTTIWAGAILWAQRGSDISGTDLITVLFSPRDLLLGAFTFALPLVLILGSHELGHYFTSRAYKVEASLPYFIPVPPLISPFGTFGALISMKENMSNRKALVDIGVAGPVAGFLVAIPVTVLGLVLTNTFPAEMTEMVPGNTYFMINPPLAFNVFAELLGTSTEGPIFPTALAGWIGLFVTALNLFPVGQLDGGHIVRGIFGGNARFISYATIAIMVFLGFVTGFSTYLLFAFLILLLGARHPPPLDDLTRVDKRQVAAFAFAVFMMAVTFHPVPLEAVTYERGSIELRAHQDFAIADDAVPGLYTATVMNTGSDPEDVEVRVFYEGEQVLPNLSYQGRGRLDGYLLEKDVIEAVYEFGGLGLYLIDPVSQRLDEGMSGDYRFLVLSDSPVDPGYNATIELEFRTGSGLLR